MIFLSRYVGQWAPIVGTGLAAYGSLYVYLANYLEQRSIAPGHGPDRLLEDGSDGTELAPAPSNSIATPCAAHVRSQSVDGEVLPTSDRRASDTTYHGHRRKVANALTAFGNYFSNTPHETFDDSEFRSGNARQYPEVPGESERNEALPQIKLNWNGNDNDGAPSIRGRRSRAASVSGSPSSNLGGEGASPTLRTSSLQPPQSKATL